VLGLAIPARAGIHEFIEKNHQKNELPGQAFQPISHKAIQKICHKTIASCNCPKIDTNHL
jgi:hypothetical protein